MVFIRLFAFLLLFFIEKSMSKSSSLPQLIPKELRTLKSFLMQKFPVLLENPSHSLNYFDVNVPSACQLYTINNFPIHINTSSSNLIISSILLESADFFIRDKPKINFKYPNQLTLDLQFVPSAIGTRADFLVICALSEIFVYYLKGIGEENQFQLCEINIEYFQGTYGVADVFIFNPFEYALEIQAIGSKNPNFSVKKSTFRIEPQKLLDVAVIRAYFTGLGEYFDTLEIKIQDTTFLVPIKVKVSYPGLELPKLINFGVLTKKDFNYPQSIIAKNTGKSKIRILSITSNHKHAKINHIIKSLDSYSEKKEIGEIRLIPNKEELISFTIEVLTQDRVFKIECKAFVILNFLSLSSKYIAYNPEGFANYETRIISKFPLEIYPQKIATDSKSINFSGLSKISPNNNNWVKITISGHSKSVSLLKVQSCLGLIKLPVMIQEPIIEIKRLVNGEAQGLSGPINLGNVGFESQVTISLSLLNPNSFEVVLNLIESLPKSKLEMPKLNKIAANSSLDFSVSLKAEKSFFHPLTLHTSIGTFFIPVLINVVSGIGKISPIHFTDMSPGCSKEQSIYFTNLYPVPIKVVSITSQNPSVLVRLFNEEVMPDKEQVIGKVKVIYNRFENAQIDFNRSLTVGDARTWNFMLHFWEKGEKITDLTILTDVGGEIQVPITTGFAEPFIKIDFLPKFDYCRIDEVCTGFIKISNTLNVSILGNLLITPEFMFNELRNFDCFNYNKNQNYDDEFENINTNHDSVMKKKECYVRASEEIQIIKIATEKKVFPTKSESLTTSLVEKIRKSLVDSEDYNEMPKKNLSSEKNSLYSNWLNSQSLFLNGKKNVIIPAKSHRLLGPIYFKPIIPGYNHLSLIFKNNYTVIEGITFTANAGYTKLAFMKRSTYLFNGNEYVLHKSSIRKELHKLTFDISVEEIEKFMLSKSSLISPKFIRTFELQNVGNIDIEINEITFEANACQIEGYSLNDCKKSLILKPSESIILQISFNPSLSLIHRNIELWIFTNNGLFSFVVEMKMPEELNIDIFLSFFGEESIIFSLSFTFAVLAILVKISFVRKNTKVKARSTKDLKEFLAEKRFYKKYNQPLFISQGQLIEGFEKIKKTDKHEPLENLSEKNKIIFEKNENELEKFGFNSEKEFLTEFENKNALNDEKNDLKSILNEKDSEKIDQTSKTSDKSSEVSESFYAVPQKSRKKLKFKRIFSNIQKAEDFKPLKNVVQLPEVIATNKFLIEKKSKRKKSDEPAPKPKETISAEEDDDFFIDSYKVNNILFGSITERESIWHSEYSRDSDETNNLLD